MRKLVTYKFESSSRSSLHWIIIYILYNAMWWWWWWWWWWWDVRYVCFLLSSCEDVSTDCEDCHAGVPTCLVSTLIMMVGNRHWWWWWWRRFWSPLLPSSSLKVSFCIIHELANLDLWLRRLHWRSMQDYNNDYNNHHNYNCPRDNYNNNGPGHRCNSHFDKDASHCHCH